MRGIQNTKAIAEYLVDLSRVVPYGGGSQLLIGWLSAVAAQSLAGEKVYRTLAKLPFLLHGHCLVLSTRETPG